MVHWIQVLSATSKRQRMVQEKYHCSNGLLLENVFGGLEGPQGTQARAARDHEL